MKHRVDEVFDAFVKNPKKMEEALKGDEKEVIRSLLGNDVSSDELNEITKEVNENNVMKLYRGANGQLDADDLIHMVGGFTKEATRANPNQNAGIAALLDGKVDVNDLLGVVGLLGGGVSKGSLLESLLGTSQKPQQSNDPMNILGSLFGNPQSQQQQSNPSLFHSLFSNPTVQQQNATPTDILSTLFGAAQQPQQSQQAQNPLSALFGGSSQQNQQPQNPLSALFGGAQQSQPQQQNPSNILEALLGGGQQQTQQSQQVSQNDLISALFGGAKPQQSQQSSNSILGNLFGSSNSQQATNSQFPHQSFGMSQPSQNQQNTVNSSEVFDVLSALLGKK